MIETARGPVVIGGLDPRALDTVGPLSLRYPPRVTGDLGFSALLPLLRARDVADVDRAFDRWAEPVNVVQAADTEGGLLHRVAGTGAGAAPGQPASRSSPPGSPGTSGSGWHEPPPARRPTASP